MAHRSGAIEIKDLKRVVVDTTVQEKAIAHSTDAQLTPSPSISETAKMSSARKMIEDVESAAL